jgi:Ser/Thr protein kinase RdoA (MazF antagonist)
VQIGQTSFFPVTFSILSAEALLAEVARIYAVDAPQTCQLLQRGLNDTYLVRTQGDRYIARVYRAGWRTWSEIAYELELLTHLAGKGVSVSVPIPARDGTLIRALPAPEGTRHLVLFTYAEGTPLSWDQEAHCYRAGRLLAAIHAASDDFVSRHARCSLDLVYLIDRPLTAIRPFLAHRPEDWRYLEALATRLRDQVEGMAAGLDWGVCHGDFGANNIHGDEDRRLTIFDFDFCGPGWRAFDFVAAHRLAVHDDTNAIWRPFVRGYAEIRHPGETDLATVPLFNGLCRLRSVGLHAGKVVEVGTSRVGDWYLDRELAFFRKWGAEHLRIDNPEL